MQQLKAFRFSHFTFPTPNLIILCFVLHFEFSVVGLEGGREEGYSEKALATVIV